MGVFDQLILSAKSAGIFAFYLPFLIVFALLYGLLTRIALFGKENRMTNALNAIISFSIALFVIGFTPAGISVSQFFGNFFSQATIAIVTIIIGIVVLVVLGETLGPYARIRTQEGERLGPRGFEFGKYVGLIIVLVIVGVFINSGGLQAIGLGNATSGIAGLSGQDMAILLFIVITGLLVYWVTGGK